MKQIILPNVGAGTCAGSRARAMDDNYAEIAERLAHASIAFYKRPTDERFAGVCFQRKCLGAMELLDEIGKK